MKTIKNCWIKRTRVATARLKLYTRQQKAIDSILKAMQSSKVKSVDTNNTSLTNIHDGEQMTSIRAIRDHKQKFVRLKNWITGKQVTDTLHQQKNRVRSTITFIPRAFVYEYEPLFIISIYDIWTMVLYVLSYKEIVSENIWNST